MRVPVSESRIAGNTRLSARDRSSTISLLPVPLNSSKIMSSIRDPVSTRAVAITVTDPPSSTLRAMPKNLRGISSARESSPPLIVRPESEPCELNARPMRVMLSTSTTTS